MVNKERSSKRNKRNKRQGDGWSYKVVRFFADCFELTAFDNKNHAEWQVATSKAMSKGKDGMGIDVVFREDQPEYIQRLLPQNKKTLSKGKKSTSIDIQPLLNIHKLRPESDIPLLFTKVTRETKSRESTVCELVTMEMKDFRIFLEAYKVKNKEK